MVVPDHKPGLSPVMAEPWFLAFNSCIEIHPGMAPEGLLDVGPTIAQAGAK
jgi:hypothetical protein